MSNYPFAGPHWNSETPPGIDEVFHAGDRFHRRARPPATYVLALKRFKNG